MYYELNACRCERGVLETVQRGKCEARTASDDDDDDDEAARAAAPGGRADSRGSSSDARSRTEQTVSATQPCNTINLQPRSRAMLLRV
jgi:hypothetical protein